MLHAYNACVATGGLQKRNATSSVEVQSGDGKSPNQEDKIQLQRVVGLFSAVNLIIGVMIGKWIASACQHNEVLTCVADWLTG